MTYSNISHISMKVGDPETAFDFYVNQMGFKKQYGLNHDVFIDMLVEDRKKGIALFEGVDEMIEALLPLRDKLWMAYLQIRENQFIELFFTYGEAERSVSSPTVLGYQHMSLQVPDIRAARAELMAKGANIKSEIKKGPDFTYQFWLEDPFGNQIELMEYTPESLQIVGNEF